MGVQTAEKTASAPADTAARFVAARLKATALPDFPGDVPADLETGYASQEAAIGLWPDELAGWKVGRIADALQNKYGQARLAGPIFRRAVWVANGEAVAFPVFAGGFAAVEAEFVFRIGVDAPADKVEWTTEEVADLVGALHAGIETAGSPLATINDLGPTVVVSDFGNNAGLILGPSVDDWRARLDGLTCETFVDGVSVGRGGAASLPGGPLGALKFLARHCALRGRPLKAGQLISTGAATGIHDVVAGQTGRVEFAGCGDIACVAVTAQAHTQDTKNVRTA
ncbi:2-keto-4-pentenoate hydratase [Caulobacter sp. 17J80-11]|uniref:2-keto-4-pentenoate hydratase n=1 Tax=Caulobacter sp. 17J80-11 TaxID=2763502 RepID=UPI001653BE71|nr:2-keto-4-pentenoate hydratase [Caulobacter sp. 17J80-11]MBC6982657.1 2-keto-4-pentenoate hydratase [Caulobacter sp. 17J80-11]